MFICRFGVMDDSAAVVATLDPKLAVVLYVGVHGLTLFVALITAALSFA